MYQERLAEEEEEDDVVSAGATGTDRKIPPPLRRASKLGAIAQRSLVLTPSIGIGIDTTDKTFIQKRQQQQQPSSSSSSTATTTTTTTTKQQHSEDPLSYRLPLESTFTSSSHRHRGRSNSPSAPITVDASLVGPAKLSPRLRAVQLQSLSNQSSSSSSSSSVDGHRRLSRSSIVTGSGLVVSSSLVGGPSSIHNHSITSSSPPVSVGDEFDTLLDQTMLELGIAYSKLH